MNKSQIEIAKLLTRVDENEEGKRKNVWSENDYQNRRRRSKRGGEFRRLLLQDDQQLVM